MASRLIDGVPPRYPAREERSAEDASHELREVIVDFIDQSERIVAAREAFPLRCQTELDSWVNAERHRLGLDGMSFPPVPQNLESQIEQRVLAEVLTEFGIEDMDTPPRLQIRAAAGLGKTSAIIDELAQRDFWRERHVHMYVPTGALAEELAEKIAEKGLCVRVVRGRGSRDMCKKRKAAQKAAMLGLNVYQTMCKRKGSNGRERICPHYHSCPYIAQWHDIEPAIRIFAHDYLRLPKPRPDGYGLPEPDLVIVDESAVDKLIGTESFGVDRLSGPTSEAIRDYLEQGKDLQQGLRDRGITVKSAKKMAADLIAKIETEVTPDMPEEEALNRLDEAKQQEVHKLARFWHRVAAEIDLDRPFHGIEVSKNERVYLNGVPECQHRIRVHWPHRPVISQRTPLLMIDANADREINRVFFGSRLKSIEIEACRNAYVVQCYSTRLSKSALLGLRAKKSPQQTHAMRKVIAIIEKEAAQGGKVLVIMPLQLRRFLTTHVDELGNGSARKLPRSEMWRGVEIAHFGNIRGSDEWSDYDTVIIVGREELPPINIDRKARAIWADDHEPLKLVGNARLSERPYGYRLRDGALKGVLTSIHPDPRAQRVLELVRECEILQAIDRLRLIHAKQPKRALILCSIPLDITVDAIQSLDQLAGTPGREGPLARLQRCLDTVGLVPLGARDLYQAFAGEPLNYYPSENSAREALKEARREDRKRAPENGGLNQYRYIFDDAPHLRIAEYRRDGQRGHASRVVYAPNQCPDPYIILSLLLGELIEDFEEVSDDPQEN